MKLSFFNKSRIRGFLEFVDGREVVGWAVDLNRPAEPVTLDIMVDDEVIGSAQTSLSRPDVAKKYNIDGTFGFNFYAWPPIADNDIDRTRVRVRGVNTE